MAPREPFKVHSLSKHIEETKKKMNADRKVFARTPIKKDAAPVPSIFDRDNGSDSDTSSDGSSSSDDSDIDSAAFMKKLAAKSSASKRRNTGEEVADSDVERASATNETKPADKVATPIKAIKAYSSPSPKKTSVAAVEKGSEKKVRPDGPTQKSEATSPSSSSDSDSSSSSSSEASSSDNDSEGENESETVPAKAPVALEKSADKSSLSKQTESDSDNSTSEEAESESDGDSPPAAKPKRKPVANGVKTTTTKAKATKADNSSDETSKERSGDESRDGAESSDEEPSDDSIPISEQAQTGQVGLSRFVPHNIELGKSDKHSNGQDVARICKEAILQGKQFWYFTVPHAVPVSLVQKLEFPVDASQQGDNILSHNGEDYGVSFDSTAPTKSFEILIPATKDSAYQSSRQTTDKVVQLRAITQIGVTTATPSAIGSSTNVARSQPIDLKPRFQPMEFSSYMSTAGAGASTSHDVEMQDTPANGSTPKTAKKKDKKRVGASDSKETANKGKKSKREHSDSEDGDAAAAEQLMEESVSAVTKHKKQKTTRRASLDPGTPVSASAVRQTTVLPPALPASLATRATVSTPVKKTKKTTTTKSSANPITPHRGAQVPGITKKETPVPVPVLPGWRSSAATASATVKQSPKDQKSAAATRSPS
ncbi:RNA polymerase I, subunit RPA34.5 [Cordyceps militaris CM01]|uniref:RNA polymerase I, subunit RPA34.5 n=1 Tax=Cordyceps militaris (strain CM01) TaxID=983644 RepID=G3J4D6_CORMM|nr:RNA polymerase I, subunit RPA34.5 [Cordyceps militaris CM01]EGX96653.1 RNA polymerase I, subunit RPA34.5 [Cordyceps militaris CM01]